MKGLSLRAMVVLGAVGGVVAIAPTTAVAETYPNCPVSTLCMYNSSYQNTEGFGCGPYVWKDPVLPIYAITNACGTRVWVHQYANNTGWSFCISPYVFGRVNAGYRNPGNIQVSSNPRDC
jgi:hypothetical protein